MKHSVLFAWLGTTDVNASKENRFPGPIRRALQDETYSHAFILANDTDSNITTYKKWISQAKPDVSIEIFLVSLSSPSNFSEVYENARDKIHEAMNCLKEKGIACPALTFHLSPGTPIMALAWVVLGKTLFPAARLIESSQPEIGVKSVDLPFDIAFDYLPDLKKKFASYNSIVSDEIICACKSMKEVVQEAIKVAAHDVTRILLLGESGTGKELFARHIHRNSPRRNKPFKVINCAAIPKDLVESELFGHIEGAFTGAKCDKKGIFEEANGGVVFLDEIGEFEKDLQAKLLRALQENKIRKVGSNDEKKIDVMVISATNRDLGREVADGNFRGDLFYRLSVYDIKLPPLRERSGDITVLIEFFLDKLNRDMESKDSIAWKSKSISDEARKALNVHNWPGNIRELDYAIFKAALHAKGEIIGVADVQRALRTNICQNNDDQDILNRQLGNGFSLNRLLHEVEVHYIKRALEQTEKNGRINETVAANLLGLSRQTFVNRRQNIDS